MSVAVCDGCGRVAGEREVYCGACGRMLPGRSADESDAAPPGWLVSTTARNQSGPWFEPMPAVHVAVGAASGYRVFERRADRDAPGPRLAAPPPPPLPLAGAEVAAPAAVASAPGPGTPSLRVLLLPLIVVAVGSSVAAVALLVLHLLRDR